MAKDLPVDILVSKGRYWLLLDGTGSLYCGTSWYLVILGRNRAVLVASVICFQKIYGLHGVNHQIIQYSEREKWWGTDKQTDRQTFQSMTRSLLWKGSINKVRQYNHAQIEWLVQNLCDVFVVCHFSLKIFHFETIILSIVFLLSPRFWQKSAPPVLVSLLGTIPLRRNTQSSDISLKNGGGPIFLALVKTRSF